MWFHKIGLFPRLFLPDTQRKPLPKAGLLLFVRCVTADIARGVVHGGVAAVAGGGDGELGVVVLDSTLVKGQGIARQWVVDMGARMKTV